MRKILFRVDASVKIGYGHLIRCTCIALYAKEHSVDCLFILKNSDENVQEMLREKDLEYIIITKEADLLEIKNGDKILVVDVNNPVLFKETGEYKNYLLFLKEKGFKIVLFEDFVKDVFPADLVIIPYVNAEDLGYNNTPGTQYLLGPDYFVFRAEFALSPKVVIREEVKNIFVCMGGSDPGKLTEKITRQFAGYPNAFHLNIVFAQLDDARRENLESLLHAYKGSYKILINPPFISSVMRNSDLGIINSGLIKYETCVMGLPCISLSNNTFQEKMMQVFADKNILCHIGIASEVTDQMFYTALDSIVRDREKRSTVSQNSLRLCDGKGVERIFEKMQNLKN